MLIRPALALLAMLAALPALPACGAELSVKDCPPLAASPEAARYALQGSTTLEIKRAANGVPASVRLLAGSGWQRLDDDALAHAKNCRFAQPPHGKAADADTLTITWPAAPQPAGAVAPSLVDDSCRKSAVFRPGPAARGADTLRVRLLVWTDGQVFSPKLASSSGDVQVDELALAWVQSCRYAPALRNGAAARGSAILEVTLLRKAYDEDALRAVYERVLPLLRSHAAGRTEHKLAHILLAEEANARATHAAIVKGASFAERARQFSLDRSAREGDLGWADAHDFGPEFAAAVLAAKGEGLLPDVVRTEYGWHLIRIDGSRRAAPAPFVKLRTAIRGWILRDELDKFEELVRTQR
ncbi:MAG: energy transducer TonB [Pseudomonadota bacterium]